MWLSEANTNISRLSGRSSSLLQRHSTHEIWIGCRVVSSLRARSYQTGLATSSGQSSRHSTNRRASSGRRLTATLDDRCQMVTSTGQFSSSRRLPPLMTRATWNGWQSTATMEDRCYGRYRIISLASRREGCSTTIVLQLGQLHQLRQLSLAGQDTYH